MFLIPFAVPTFHGFVTRPPASSSFELPLLQNWNFLRATTFHMNQFSSQCRYLLDKTLSLIAELLFLPVDTSIPPLRD